MNISDLVNKPNKMDGINLLDLLAQNPSETARVAFFDPQYRGILDKLNYGNEGRERGQNRCSLPQMDEDVIIKFVNKICNILEPSGYLFLWIDKFHLCEGINRWIENTSLSIVDLITWDKENIGMGYRTRRRAEYLLILQKEPIVVKGTWNNHTIPDVWQEKIRKTHPHSKPVELQQLLIEATTKEGDIVLDPAAGGYSVLFACLNCNRTFLGCDIETDPEMSVSYQLKLAN